MTNEEALNWFKDDLKNGKCSDECPQCNAMEKAIEALEKQIPKKPLNLCGRYFEKAKGGNCPCCGAQTNSSTYTYCRKCGQKLLWE